LNYYRLRSTSSWSRTSDHSRIRRALSPLSYRGKWGDQAGSLKTAANRITICRAADYTMITMHLECAIGVEPMKSTLCRRWIKPWPLGYAHMEKKVAWDGFEPSRGLLQRQVGYQLPHQARRVGEGRFSRNLRPRGSKPLTLT